MDNREVYLLVKGVSPIHPFIVLLVTGILFADLSTEASVIISEFMAINNTTLGDEDGAYSDWIELYNSGTNAVNLGGWYLSNKSTNLTQWRFPSTNIGPQTFLVVFASNKDRRAAGAPLHTNFKLSGSGEYLALVLPDGLSKATELAPTFPPQFPDVSYGYVLTGAQVPTYFYPATPGAWNNNAGSAVAPPAATFWPPAGVYASNVLTISLTTPASAAAIRYTLDGSTPGNTSRLYTGPITVGSNTVVRARSELAGVPGRVSAANYLLLNPSVTNFSSNLPLVVIDTMGQNIPDGSKIPCYAMFINTNATSGRAWPTNTPDYAGRLSIGLHGSSSLQFPKLPYSIEVDDETGHSTNFNLLAFPPGSDWVLNPPYSDKTFMNDVLAQRLFADMGHYAARCQYVEIFLHRSPGRLGMGDYQGIYFLQERIRVDPNRVNIAKLEPTDNAAPAVTGGYILNKDRIEPTNDVSFTTSRGEQLIVYRPKPDQLTSAQYDYISNYVNAFEAALFGANWRDPLSGYAAYIDVDSFVDAHWIVEYPKNIDGLQLSGYMSKDRNGKLKMEPIWDWDLSWGNANYSAGGNTNGWLNDNGNIWLGKLRSDPDFCQKIVDRWGELRLGIFNPTNLYARIDGITNYLWEAQARDFLFWPRLGSYVWPNPNGPAGGWDVDYVSPRSYLGIIAQLKKFILGRYLWIDSQFIPAPTLLSNAGTLTMRAPRGWIYYTLDGTDPRAPGGGVSRVARQYDGPILVTNNVAVFARACYGTGWSAPSKRLFVLDHLPGPPLLSAQLLGNNQLAVTWPITTGACKLFSSASFGPSSSWTLVTNSPALCGEYWSVTLPLVTNTCLYRLQQTSP